jgi:predicted Fe-Mo cluster-binding NifX family protein
VYLPIEGAEALRLVDIDGLDHNNAARRMDVSRHTFGRILAQARRVVSRAITEGMAICIEGGDFIVKAEGPDKSSLSLKKTPNDQTVGKRVQAGITKTEEDRMEKIAISSEGPSLDDQVDPRFGRAGGFIIVDPDTMATQYIDNGASQVMGHGAGLQAAENVATAGAKVVLSDYVGPKAFSALTAVGIKVGQNCGNMTVREAVEKFIKGEIPIADKSNK